MEILLNKKIIFAFTLAFCFFAFVSSVSAATLSRPPNNLGLVGYWNFNEGTSTVATDFSGNGYNATLVNAPTWVAGKMGSALNFNGTTQYVQLPNIASRFVNEATFSIWMKRESNSVPNADSNSASWYLGGVGAGGGSHYPWTENSIYDATFSDTRKSIGVHTLDRTQWNHIVITTNGTTNEWKIYQNGRLFYTGVPNTFLMPTAPELAHSPLYGGYYVGLLDEARIYNRALTAAQVSALYNSGSSKFGSSNALTAGTLNNGLVGHWTFDGKDTEWRTNTTRDVSGQGNTGTHVGLSTSTTPVAGQFGQAFKFATNTANYVQLASTTVTSMNTNLTVSAWVYPTNSDCCQGILQKGSQYGSLSQYRLATGYAGSGIAYLRFLIGDGVSSVESNFVLGAAITALNNWHHAACSTDTTTMYCYWDGVFVASSSRAAIGPTFTGDNWFALGTLNPNQFYYGGRVDDVRIYNRALSAIEVQQLYGLAQGKTNASSTALAQGSSLATELSLHWTFDGLDTVTAIADRSGQANNGFFTGGATSSAKTIGKMGQAFSFDGVNDYVAGAFDPPNTSQTMSVWVKTSSSGVARSILGFTTGLPTSGTHDRQFYLNSGGTVTYRVYDVSEKTVTSSATITDNSWHLVTGRYETGVGISLFIDGVQQGAVVSTAALFNYTSPQPYLALGIDSLTNVYWLGQLDDMRFYSRALSNAEIKQLYKMGN